MELMTVAGVAPAGKLVDVYVLYDDGTPGHMQVPEGTDPVLSRPGRLVPQEEHEERVQELADASAAYVAGLEAGDEERRAEDYAALRAAGVAEPSARRMAGYVDGRG